jgi:hypothetical protein
VTGEGWEGYTNRATWCVHLWLTNDEPLYRAALEVVRFGNQYAAASALKQWVIHEVLPARAAMTYDCDPIDECNWLEVANALRDHLSDEVDGT